MWNTNKFKTEVKETQTITAKFIYSGDKIIKKVRKSCGCTSIKWLDNNILEAKIDTGFVKDNVPSRLYKQGRDFYIKNASVDIIYEDDSIDTLSIEATVKQQFKDNK